MSESVTTEKPKQIPMSEANPRYCISYTPTWENYYRMNRELYKQKMLHMGAVTFVLLMIIGTVCMTADTLQLLGWAVYCAAILLLGGLPFIWQCILRFQFRSAQVNSNEEWKYAFYDESFTLHTKNVIVTRKYSDLYCIVESADYIYLLLAMNHALPVPRDKAQRDTFFLSLGKQRIKDRISPVLCWLYVLSGILTAFYGMTAARLPYQWLLQTWVYVICAAMPCIWIITIVLTGVSWNRHRISCVQKTGVRIVLRVLLFMLCSLLILGLGLFDTVFIFDRYPIIKNDNGTYTEHVDDKYAPFEYYLYQSQGPFFLKYLRPMTNANDTDPTISESEWFSRMKSNNGTATTSTTEYREDPSRAFDTSVQDAEEEKRRIGALKIFDMYFVPQGSTFKEHYTAKGDRYFVLHESNSDIAYLQYDRDSKNGNCGLYVVFKAIKSLDGRWSPYDTQMQNIYAYEYNTGTIVKSDKASWSDAGSEEYRTLTGEL